MGKPNLTIRTEQTWMDRLKKRATSDELSISDGVNHAIAAYLGLNMPKTIPERMAAIEQ